MVGQKSTSGERKMAGIFLLVVFGLASVACKAPPFWESCLSRYYSRPRCDDTPVGYECICGPGFEWNTNLCMSTAVDSRLEYEKAEPVRYTLLLDIPFPELHAFTVTLWMKVPYTANHSTIFSYNYDDHENFLRLFLREKTIWITMCQTTINTKVRVARNQWTHFALSWNGAKRGLWTVYINGERVSRGSGLLTCQYCNGTVPCVPSGGEFVLGQSSRESLGKPFDTSVSFVGSLAHVNLWVSVRPDSDIRDVYEDCTFSHCGDVTWVQFRAGTRGAMRLRWPSGIQSKACYNEARAELTCDKYCSQEFGVQCKERIKENIVWHRTPANTSIRVPCPGQNSQAMATRSCHKTQYVGVWDEPEFAECISVPLLDIKKKIQKSLKPGEFEVKHSDLPTMFIEQIHNLTLHNNFTNPMDLSTVIDCLDLIIDAQEALVSDPRVSVLMTHSKEQNDKHGFNLNQLDPTDEEAIRFSKLFFEILDMIIAQGQEVGWNNTKPPGEEGDEFIKVLEKGTKVTYKALLFHVKETKQIAGNQAEFRQHYKKSVIKVRLMKVKDFVGVPFPSIRDAEDMNMTDQYGFAILPEHSLDQEIKRLNLTDDDYIGISTIRYSGFRLKLPNHNVESSSMEDNVNSELFGVYIHVETGSVTTLLDPISIEFNFTNTFNISNPECVMLQHGKSSSLWSWVPYDTALNESSELHARCEFFTPGLFAVTTDMYDVNWNKGERPHDLMTVPTYIGCSISAMLCLITLIMLLYLRTSSPTTDIHKNFSLALVCCHLTFLFGINQIHNELVCHVFAVLFHYFFLTTFMWLMNEGFNLYITITYSAHSHGQDTGGTSKYRSYILGWVLPGVLVGAFVGSHTNDYYAQDMCWIAWEYIWLFLGPPMGIVCVTMLVLTFTAKEQSESAYAKDESANKILQNHTRAVWIQLILLNVLWTFAFLSLKMRGNIIKYLFALFNVLQGSFFFVFYFLLNEEVRGIYRQRRIKKNLAIQGYELSSSAEALNQSNDSLIGDHSDGDDEDEHTDGACGNEPLVPRTGKGKVNNKKDRKLELRVHSVDSLSANDDVRQTAV